MGRTPRRRLKDFKALNQPTNQLSPCKREFNDFRVRLPHIRHILLTLLNDPVLINQSMEGISEREILETINAHLPRSEPNMLPHAPPLSREAREALVLAEAEG